MSDMERERDEHGHYIAEVRRLQQQEQAVAPDIDDMMNLTAELGRLRQECDAITQQRDAALAERDALKAQAETCGCGHAGCEGTHQKRSNGVVYIDIPPETIAGDPMRHLHNSGDVEHLRTALTEARRVLREVLPVDCEHVHHPKRDQHPSDAACPVLTRASAVLAQEEK